MVVRTVLPLRATTNGDDEKEIQVAGEDEGRQDHGTVNPRRHKRPAYIMGNPTAKRE